MGGLRAASGAGSSGVAMACVVASEVATVLAVMRRNVRWAGVRYGGGAEEEHLDHPLIVWLKSLRRRAAAWGTRWPEDPLFCLRPFLDVVRSDKTGAPITGFVLSSLHKLLSLDLVAPGGGAAEAMGAVVEAVTGCRFEVTDPASEEAVLARVLQVLLACVRGRAAPALSNRHACAIVTTCFRVVQQAGTKGELLQRVSRQTMQEVIRCVFGRLADIEPTTIVNEQRALVLCSDTVEALYLSQRSAEDNMAASNLWSRSVRSFFRLHRDHDEMAVVVSAFRMKAFCCIFSWTNRSTNAAFLAAIYLS